MKFTLTLLLSLPPLLLSFPQHSSRPGKPHTLALSRLRARAQTLSSTLTETLIPRAELESKRSLIRPFGNPHFDHQLVQRSEDGQSIFKSTIILIISFLFLFTDNHHMYIYFLSYLLEIRLF